MSKDPKASEIAVMKTEPVRLERVDVPIAQGPTEKRVLIVHNFQWHLIIYAIGAIILSVAAVAF